MTQLEDALKIILGYFPYYMRPPFLSTNAQALSTLNSLQYIITEIDIDTKDYENTSNDTINNAYVNYVNALNAGGTISLSHDPLINTAQFLVPGILRELANRGLKSVPIGQCLGDPAANWYRTSRPGSAVSSSFVHPSSSSVHLF
jgi:peptidoglycan/xylan/chitin deacetylase (PgdA/CDA1 family)